MADPTLTSDEIRELRQTLGISQGAFGETHFRATQATVARWETGACVPHRLTMDKLVELWNGTMPASRRKKARK